MAKQIQEIQAKSRYNQFDYVDKGLDCSGDPGLTKQSFKDECDINNILKKYEVTGQLTHMIQDNPQYGDFSDAKTYQESMEIVLKAQNQFENLNAHIRARFDNDPMKFLEFATDDQNSDEMIKLGLATAKKAVEAAPITSEVVPPESTQ